jgi:uncharacterized protein YxeA
MKKLLIIIVLISIGAGGYYFYQHNKKSINGSIPEVQVQDIHGLPNNGDKAVQESQNYGDKVHSATQDASGQ